MERRKREINNFECAIALHNWELCLETCFKILYGLPYYLQIELCCYIINRYLPIFENRNPKIKWPHNILINIGLYFDQNGKNIPHQEEGLCLSDSLFIFCFNALLLAYCYRDNTEILTSSSSCAINASIQAMSYNAWIDDDPEALKMWEDGTIQIERMMYSNSAFKDVCKKEWNAVMNWLLEKKVMDYPDEVDVNKMDQFIKYWKEGELALIIPETRKLFEEKDNSNRLRLIDFMG
ncbi:MAG: hypothetical protein WC799_17925 [Desulfobacteraceae bacterium]|jgi:hypothetical protein